MVEMTAVMRVLYKTPSCSAVPAPTLEIPLRPRQPQVLEQTELDTATVFPPELWSPHTFPTRARVAGPCLFP